MFTTKPEDEKKKQRRLAGEKRKLERRSTNRTPGARMCGSVWTGPKKEAPPAVRSSLGIQAEALKKVLKTAITNGLSEVRTTGLGGVSKTTFTADRYQRTIDHCDRIIAREMGLSL